MMSARWSWAFPFGLIVSAVMLLHPRLPALLSLLAGLLLVSSQRGKEVPKWKRGLEKRGVTLYGAKSVPGCLLTSHVVQSVDRESVFACPWLNKHICIRLLPIYSLLDNKNSLLFWSWYKIHPTEVMNGKQAEVPYPHTSPYFLPEKSVFPGEGGFSCGTSVMADC